MRIIFILSLLSLSCISNQNPDLKPWELINPTGLMQSNESFEDIIFLNDKVGFLFGTNDTDDVILNKRFDEQNAVIYKSIDAGYNWDRKNFGKGQFVDACHIGDTIFALKNRFVKNYVVVDSSVIFASYDKGDNWVQTARFNYHIRNINFITSLTGIAIGNKKKNGHTQRKMLKTIDGGKTWDELSIKESVLSTTIDSDYNIWMLSANAKGVKNSLIRRNFWTSDTAELEGLPPNFDPMQIAQSDKSPDLWLLGKENEQITLYRRNKSDRYIKVKTFNSSMLFPASLYVKGAYIAFFAGKINSFSVSYRLFISHDYGASWKSEDPIVKTYIDPFTFYNKKLWAYAGAGNIQVRN